MVCIRCVQWCVYQAWLEYELADDSNTTATVQVDEHQATSNTAAINGINSEERDAVVHKAIENGISSHIILDATTIHQSEKDIAISQKEEPLGNKGLTRGGISGRCLASD
ncbi:unnamed protein product [Cuscuta europaea]|uniref:Uncharacterized protein n=1 Tax=Cuscuta europaea TaxID=41803 RepID=A0A9P1DZH4_CUSEU|nr:unnamed protein product [Cuscuta europaea]